MSDPERSARGAGAERVVLIDGLHFTYEGSDRAALRNISLEIRRGELVVVIGPSGAGKSTLAKCLNRTVPSFQHGDLTGTIEVLGEAVSHCQVADLAGRVGLVLQDFEAQLFATDVVQEVAFGLEQLGVPSSEIRGRVQQALAMVGLEAFEHRDPTTLSGGEKQRLAIAAVIAMQPPILVLDEPTTDLDPLGKRDVLRVLASMRRLGHTLVVIEHELEAIESIDRIVLLHDGEIVAQGPARSVLRDVELLRRFGVRPRDVDRLAAAFSLPDASESMAQVEQDLRARGAAPATVPPTAPRPAGEVFLEAKAVSFRYPGGAMVLQDIDLAIREGEFVALIGQNGSGKTTLAKLFNGLLRPARGEILLAGCEISGQAVSSIASRVGYVFQDPDQQLFAPTVREEVEFGPKNLGVREPELTERVVESLAAVGLSSMEDTDPFLLTKGERQRLAVAALLAQRPHLLVLDEPTTGLDYREQLRMMDLIRRLHRSGLILVVITHSPWIVAEYAERGILVADGKIAFDGPLRELFGEEELLERCHFRVPDATRLGNRLGVRALSVDELVAQLAFPASRQPVPAERPPT